MRKMNHTIFRDRKCGSSHPPLPYCQRADKSCCTRTTLHFSRSGAHKTLLVTTFVCMPLFIQSAVLPLLFSPCFLFFFLITPSVGFWSGNTDADTLAHSQKRGVNCEEKSHSRRNCFPVTNVISICNNPSFSALVSLSYKNNKVCICIQSIQVSVLFLFFFLSAVCPHVHFQNRCCHLM